MTTQEQTELKFAIRLMKWAVGIGVVAIFSAGMLWATTKDTLDMVAPLVDSVGTLKREQAEDRHVMRDFLLLVCADENLNVTQRRICARHEPRMPR